MYLKLINNLSEEIDLSLDTTRNFRPRFSALNKRVNSVDRYGKPGSVIVADENYNSREISFDFDISEITDSSYKSLLNEIIGFFATNKAPYYLHDTDNNIRTKVNFKSLSENPESGNIYRVARCKLVLLMNDVFWEDLTSSTVSSETGGLSTGESLTVNNTGNLNIYPIITVTAKSSNSLFSITNQANDDKIEIGSNAFTVSDQFIIDCENGTLYLDDGVSSVESSAAISDGTGFIKLIPGNNILLYESALGDIDLDVEYRINYAF